MYMCVYIYIYINKVEIISTRISDSLTTGFVSLSFQILETPIYVVYFVCVNGIHKVLPNSNNLVISFKTLMLPFVAKVTFHGFKF
jgi:hypothetical protein